MSKDFGKWHDKKERIDELPQRPFFHDREIWFCYIGANVGVEQNGSQEEFLRPVVILRKFNNESFWAIPLTKSKKADNTHYFSFSFLPNITSAANLSQLRLIDARRLSRKIGEISESDFSQLTKRLKALLP